MIGELDAGKPHVQFDEGAQETCDRVTRLCPTLPASPNEMMHDSECETGLHFDQAPG
jgi:hypothetical protein